VEAIDPAVLAQIAARPAVEQLAGELVDASYATLDESFAIKAALTIARSGLGVLVPQAQARALESTLGGGSPVRIRARSGAWEALDAVYVGPTSTLPVRHRFAATRVRLRSSGAEPVAATRAVVAGAAWAADAALDRRALAIRALSRDPIGYDDERIGAAVEGALAEDQLQMLRRIISFVAGVEVQLLCVERYDSAGSLIDAEHRRERPKLGSATHSPFAGVDGDAVARAVGVLSDGFVRLLRLGFPIERIADQIAHANNGSLHLAAQLYALAIETTVARFAEARGGDGGRREQYAYALERLQLELGADELERVLRLRNELLRRGYFIVDGGEAREDLAFLRDLAHTIVLRLCGYGGPYYRSSERRVVELSEIPNALSTSRLER
jgi:hypothetical protein